ncbi:MAG: putative acyl-CoA transferase [Mycobacterium sp.]|nr:putative acyl-CoA transferase [Mycobacterium sp.]
MTDSACGAVRVLDFSQGMAGPLASMILADHGADVVKVEPPWGDWARELPGFAMWNRGKRAVVIDLGTPDGLREAGRLARSADVLLHDWLPKVAADRGLDRTSLAAANPGLVTCAITAAPDGRGELCVAAYDGGLAARDGRMVGLDPLSGAVPVQDRAAPIFTAAPTSAYGAALLAVNGILAAMYRRAETGCGQDVRTSLVQAEAAFLMRQDLARGGPDRAGVPGTPPAVHRGIVLSFLTAECSDGRYIQMCARQDQHFRNWMSALGMADVLEDPRYARAPLGIKDIADIEALERRIRARMLERTQDEWMTLFSTEFDVGADPFLTPAEFLSHPQMLENDRVVTVQDPEAGAMRQPGPLVLMSDTPANIHLSAPTRGQRQHVEWLLPPQSAAPRGSTDSEPTGRPLSGVTVLEIAYFVAGPLSATVLAELGARVIKVEPLEGDPSRRTGLQNSKFLAGKQSIALDLKSEGGQQILQQLLTRCDALVHNFRPGVPERLGFGFERVAQVNPRLVYLYAASYGSRGPQAHRTAFHSTPNALCGGGILQAGEGNPPVDDSYCDPGSGLAAGAALMLGLAARERTGRGQYLETSMISSAAYVHSNDMVLTDAMEQRTLPDRGQHGLGALYRLYECRSGWVFLAAWRDRDFRLLAPAVGRTDWLNRSDLASLAGRQQAADELSAYLGDFFQDRTASEWIAGLGLAPQLLVEVSAVPIEAWFEQNDLFEPMEHPEFGPYWQPPAKVSFDGVRQPAASTCSLGEHTFELLAELGFSADAIAEFSEQHAIA